MSRPFFLAPTAYEASVSISSAEDTSSRDDFPSFSSPHVREVRGNRRYRSTGRPPARTPMAWPLECFAPESGYEVHLGASARPARRPDYADAVARTHDLLARTLHPRGQLRGHHQVQRAVADQVHRRLMPGHQHMPPCAAEFLRIESASEAVAGHGVLPSRPPTTQVRCLMCTPPRRTVSRLSGEKTVTRIPCVVRSCFRGVQHRFGCLNSASMLHTSV